MPLPEYTRDKGKNHKARKSNEALFSQLTNVVKRG